MSNEHITDERAAFEAWAISVGYHIDRDMFQREKYQSTVTWELWRVWQARAALRPAAQPAELPLGAIENGREHARRLVNHYGFADLADHKLQLCADWIEFVRCFEHLADYALSAAPAAQPVGEPFGYFKAEPFGWTDCAETDEGAVALYERPQPVPDRVPMTDEQILQGQNDRGAVSLFSFMKGVRHAEAHHGITTPKADK